MFAQDKILTIDKNGNAWIMDISGATPTFTQTGGVGSNRAWSNLTDLADGTVLLTGGSNGSGPSDQGNLATATNNAEIWNPATGQWTNDASAAIGRFYHSNTLLLPDGTVLSAGGGAPGPLTNLNCGDLYARLPAQRRWQSAHRSAGDHQRPENAAAGPDLYDHARQCRRDPEARTHQVRQRNAFL